tara:strand:+ start:57 stop:644 length:588 start_codon:yes stop_codon:yes gene_type:complete
MIKSFSFFFDFSSPYAYLAHKQIRIIEKENAIKIIYKPILLGGLHKLSNITAAAYIPAKTKYIIRDCKIIAEKFKISFKFNTHFPINSLSIMRGALYAIKKEKLEDYCDQFFNAYWRDNVNLSDDIMINSLLKKLNIDQNDFNKSISSQNVKDELIKLTNEAYEKGVFGAPTFIVNKKLFWGQDRLEFVLKEAAE